MQMKRPLNVDCDVRLRIMGESTETFRIESDEGDGYDFFQKTTREPLPHHYDEWAEQLCHVVEWLIRKSGNKKTMIEWLREKEGEPETPQVYLQVTRVS